MLRLVVTADGETHKFPLRHSTATLGSAAENDIVLAMRGVSRRHAALTRRDNTILLEDLGSKNGLIVGGKRVPSIELAPGDAVQMGRAMIGLERIHTSDADLALNLSGSASTADSLQWAEADSAAGLQEEGGPRAAWRWAREVELRGADEASTPHLLEKARKAAGADCIVAFTKASNDVAILGLAGAIPEHSDLPVMIAGNDWIALEGRVILAARLSNLSPRAPWRVDFLDFVRSRLFPDHKEDRENGHPTPEVEARAPYFIAGPSQATQHLIAEIAQIARSRLDVLVTGETGVGKELVARMIHDLGPSAGGPYIAVNCTAMVADLADSDLFGVVRGAATGVEARDGFFAAAEGGTIFLDEIGDMPAKLQPKLLRVLQEREIIPVGSSRPRRLNVRVISSTNRDVEQAIAEERLRTDLKYRLGVEVKVPPLRERREDIPHLVIAFATAAARDARKRIGGVSRRALSALVEHDWPGNVRELKLVVEKAVLMCPKSGILDSTCLGLSHRLSRRETHLDTLQRATIIETLRRTGGNKAEAARLLGVSRQGLYAMLERYGLK